MYILTKPNWRKCTLSILLIWATAFFWLLNPVPLVNILISIISLFCLVLIIFEKSSHFTVIYLSFITAYVLYGYMLVNNFPIWLIMIGILLIYLYLYAYLEQMAEMIIGEKPIYLMVFSLISVETFFFLGYYVISPINRSLILSAGVYIIYGFLDSIVAKKSAKAMMSYILVFLFVFATMLITASWGQI